MATKKAEGLSPRFSSIISPDFPGSYQLKWQFRNSYTGDKQSKAVIHIYEVDTNTLIKTITVSSDDTTYDLNDTTVAWKQDEKYEWEVITYDSKGAANPVSIRAQFYYLENAAVDPLGWEDGPVAYEIGTRAYFNDMVNNLMNLLQDYVVDAKDEQDMYNDIADNLFSGDILPSRSDFVLLEQAIGFLYQKEALKGPEVDTIIENGLGSSDIHTIYKLISKVATVKPTAPTGIDINVPTIDAPTMSKVAFSSSGQDDYTVVVSWDSIDIVDGQATLEVTNLSTSEDIWYYVVDYSYGRDDYPYLSRMYYRPQDFDRINNTIVADCRYGEMFVKSTMSKIHHGLSIRSVDKRGNTSEAYSETWKAPDSYVTPLGLYRYEVEYQKAGLKATVPDTKLKYVDLYNGTDLTKTHRLADNQEGVYFYRARYVDISGQVSAYLVSSGNKFDPLDPPKAPTPYQTGSTYDSVSWAWKDVPTADYYVIQRDFPGNQSWNATDNKTFDGKNNPYSSVSLADNHSYKWKMKSVNRAGESPWVTFTGKTAARNPVTVAKPFKGAECWRTGYTLQGAYHAPGWRTDSNAANDIIQGRWIELKSGKNTDGIWVPKGQTYGNHKSLMFLDRAYWTGLLAGKEITKVEIYLHRKNSAGYPKDGRYMQFWTHNYDAKPKDAKGNYYEPFLGETIKINTNFDRGEGHWVTLPTKWGEMLRDGKIAGFAVHVEDRDMSSPDKYTYVRFYQNDTQVRITYK